MKKESGCHYLYVFRIGSVAFPVVILPLSHSVGVYGIFSRETIYISYLIK